MKLTYTCPQCHAVLNPNVKIVLKAVCNGKSALVLFSPKPGNYKAIYDGIEFNQGDVVEFFCPVCGRSLCAGVDGAFAEICYHQGADEDGTVVFSRVYGQQATYFTTREKVRSYGPDADRFGSLNFFGEAKDRE